MSDDEVPVEPDHIRRQREEGRESYDEWAERMGAEAELDITERDPPAPSSGPAPSTNGHKPDTAIERSTWWPHDNPDQTGELHPPDPPSIVLRSDGLGLFYPGTVGGVHGESGDGKSWIMQAGALQEMQAGRHVWYLDFESRYDEVTQRLIDLGGDWDAVRPFWHHSAPAEPLIIKDKWTRGGIDLAEGLDVFNPSLVVVDGVTEAMDLHGLNPLDNADFAKFRRMLLTRIADAGPACSTVDHVNKDPESRRGQAMGAQHKRAGMTGAAFEVRVDRPFARGVDGTLKLVCSKDRQGYWRKGQTVAQVDVTAGDDGRLTIEFTEPIVSVTDEGEFRPTGLMEKVSKHLELLPDGDSTRHIRRDVKGKNEYIDKAIKALVAEGFIDPVSHAVTRPYRESEDPALQ